VIIRQGRKNKHNLYLQLDDDPDGPGVSLGYIGEPEAAELLVEAANAHEAGGVPVAEEIADRLGVFR
jgi:hypothetical protein